MSCHIGTNLEIPDAACFELNDLGDVTKCDWMFVGTSGGAVVYPSSTTGLPKVCVRERVCVCVCVQCVCVCVCSGVPLLYHVSSQGVCVCVCVLCMCV